MLPDLGYWSVCRLTGSSVGYQWTSIYLAKRLKLMYFLKGLNGLSWTLPDYRATSTKSSPERWLTSSVVLQYEELFTNRSVSILATSLRGVYSMRTPVTANSFQFALTGSQRGVEPHAIVIVPGG